MHIIMFYTDKSNANNLSFIFSNKNERRQNSKFFLYKCSFDFFRFFLFAVFVIVKDGFRGG